jgi:hypothetical protein
LICILLMLFIKRLISIFIAKSISLISLFRK